MPTSAELILTITLHICPPLNVSGLWLMSCHSSDNLSFQVPMAFSRFFTTQLSLIFYTSCLEIRLLKRRILHGTDGNKNFFCKGNHQSAEQAKEAL